MSEKKWVRKNVSNLKKRKIIGEKKRKKKERIKKRKEKEKKKKKKKGKKTHGSFNISYANTPLLIFFFC